MSNRHIVQMPTSLPTQVEVGGKLYQITEISQPLYPTEQPTPIGRSTLLDDQTTVVMIAVGLVVASGSLTWLVMKAFAPVPVTTQPQTVIVQPPPPPVPEKRPYARRTCHSAGLFGWGSDCQEERGYE